MSVSNIFNLSPELFWDCDQKKVDYEKNFRFVVERVLERGNLDDLRLIKSYYGMMRMKEAAINAKFLTERTLHFCACIFEEPIQNFRCFGKSMFQ